MRIGYVSFSHLPVQAAFLRHPSLRGRPLIVGGDKAGRGRVVDASDECLTAGVKSGMAIREAAELAPSAVILPPDPDGDADVFGRALDLLERFAEAIEENGREGAWFIPTGLPTHTTTPRVVEERRLGAAIVDGIAAALGLDTRVGIGPGKFIARVAAERTSSGAVEIVAPAESAAYLAPLPITLLPLLPRSIERLKLLGISHIGAFARLPSDALPHRFGPEAGLAWRIARGGDDTPLIPRQRPETPSMRQTFEPPIEDRELLFNAARALLDRLSRPLQDQGRAFRSLRVVVGLEDGRVVDQHANLRAPTNDPRQCLSVLKSLIEALASRPIRLSYLIGPEPNEASASPERFRRLPAATADGSAASSPAIAPPASSPTAVSCFCPTSPTRAWTAVTWPSQPSVPGRFTWSHEEDGSIWPGRTP
jgi:DNA polymerase-4